MTDSATDRPVVAAIGGGHGLARALEALVQLGADTTAVVTAADDGGSSGRLRRDLGVIALGDLRQALLALTPRGAAEASLAALMGHRYEHGELAGHAVGNLALVALWERHDGDVQAAIDELAALLGCAGRVVPATTAHVDLHATVAGARVDGQASVASAPGRIERVWLEPEDAAASPAALQAVAAADTVILGPGSLYTSIAAALCVADLADAVRGARHVVWVANVATQPGETHGLDLAAHVDALQATVGPLHIDALVVHDGPPPEGPGTPLVVQGDLGVGAVVGGDLCARDGADRVLAAHDPQRLAAVLATVL